MNEAKLILGFSIDFTDLYKAQGLRQLDEVFLKYLLDTNFSLHNNLIIARDQELDKKSQSALIIELAPILEDFICELFYIKPEVKVLAKHHNDLSPLYWCKRQFIQRKVSKSATNYTDINKTIEYFKSIKLELSDELAFSQFVSSATENDDAVKLNHAFNYAAWVLLSEDGRNKHKNGVLFKAPKKLDFSNLIEVGKIDNVYKCRAQKLKTRDGFKLTDEPPTIIKALDHANYCLYCHNQSKDSCSHGLKDKNGDFAQNQMGITLTGCPLDEKISEMNYLKSLGSIIGALATAIIDNPMIAATGHRICNDCMKSCIFQKQEPVNIPYIETSVLNEVLGLPYGFEIYSLLIKWNPLNFSNYLPKPIGKHKVLIVGQGPAGFTLAHYLLKEGFIVTAIDGLKIEPLDAKLYVDFYPIKNIEELSESLDKREAKGFGGVTEYGITVRWNKNYLTIIRLILQRQENFKLYGGVRFGSAIDYHKAWTLGFDHISLAMGAGKPNIPHIPNILAKGIRTASEFLMTLHSGAAIKESIVNLQIRLPILVVGGGLTAIDTATESIAYYILQVEKFLTNYRAFGEDIFNQLNDEERIIAHEFINHAQQLEQFSNKKIELIQSWGGVKVVYRKTLQDAPSYRLNHEEIESALQEGIEFVENIKIVGIDIDEFNACKSLRHECGAILARTILIATGTQPNITLSKEDPAYFKVDNGYFIALDENFNQVVPQPIPKPSKTHIITHVNEYGKAISFFGDIHPSYKGNVVKAMASAKHGYPIVVNITSKLEPASSLNHKEFFNKLDDLLTARVEAINILTPNIVELIIQAPLCAEQFQPGQFYRLQNLSQNSLLRNNRKLTTEPLAMTGAWVDKDNGLIAMIVLEMGGSSNVCRHFRLGEIVSLMGPTGTPTHIPLNENVLLIGGGLGNAVLFSIAKAMKANNNKVLYFAGYKKAIDRFKVEEIENSSDCVIWCCDEAQLSVNRKHDKAYKGNIVAAISAYGSGMLGDIDIDLKDINRIIVIGSDKMMQAVAHARHNELKNFFNAKHIAIGSINSPMQCMMKEICAQCLQKHIDPITKQEYYVYSCSNQDQLLDEVDFNHLDSRLKQNSLQEKMCAVIINKVS